jgi:hypothetical protein
LLVEVLRGGKRTVADGLREAQQRFAADLAILPESLRSLDPGRYPMVRTEALDRLSAEVSEEIRRRELG